MRKEQEKLFTRNVLPVLAANTSVMYLLLLFVSTHCSCCCCCAAAAVAAVAAGGATILEDAAAYLDGSFRKTWIYACMASGRMLSLAPSLVAGDTTKN